MALDPLNAYFACRSRGQWQIAATNPLEQGLIGRIAYRSQRDVTESWFASGKRGNSLGLDVERSLFSTVSQYSEFLPYFERILLDTRGNQREKTHSWFFFELFLLKKKKIKINNTVVVNWLWNSELKFSSKKEIILPFLSFK